MIAKKKARREIAIFVSLFVFGFLYNAFVEYLEKQQRDEGIVSLLVVFGSGVTIACSIPLIGWRKAKKVFLCFVASGTPMVLGSIWRYVIEKVEQKKRRKRWKGEDADKEEGWGLRLERQST